MTAWAYIAHKGEYWGGVAATSMPAKDLAKFISDFVKDGYEIMPIADRDEYEAKMAGMKMIHEHPDFKPKKTRRK